MTDELEKDALYLDKPTGDTLSYQGHAPYNAGHEFEVEESDGGQTEEGDTFAISESYIDENIEPLDEDGVPVKQARLSEEHDCGEGPDARDETNGGESE